MTTIRCLTCGTHLETSDCTSHAELAAKNNWLPVEIEHKAGYLCEKCSKWLNSPIHINRDYL